jgi:hypothetical protein
VEVVFIAEVMHSTPLDKLDINPFIFLTEHIRCPNWFKFEVWLVILYVTFILCTDIITQVSVFTISIKLKLFIHFLLLHVMALNYRPSSGNSYIHCTYSDIVSLPIGHCLHLGGIMHYEMPILQTWNAYI